MGIEDKRLALKRARLEAARSERPAYQPEESIGDALKGLGKNVVEGVQDYAEAASNAAPFSGLLDKAASATYAGAQEIGDLFRDPENQKDFSQRYAEDQKSRKEVADAMAKRSPIASTLGSIQGGASSLAVPMPGASMAGLPGVATRIAGSAGISALEQGTRGEDLFNPDAALQGATLSGGLQAGLEALPYVGKAVKAVATPVIDAVAPTAKSVAAKVGKKSLETLGGVPEETTSYYLKNADAVKGAKSLEDIKNQVDDFVGGIHFDMTQKQLSQDAAKDHLDRLEGKLVKAFQDRQLSLKEAQSEAKDMLSSAWNQTVDKMKSVKPPTELRQQIMDDLSNLRTSVSKGSGEGFDALADSGINVQTPRLKGYLTSKMNELKIGGATPVGEQASAFGKLQAYRDMIDNMPREIPATEAKKLVQAIDADLKKVYQAGSADYSPMAGRSLRDFRGNIDDILKESGPYADKMAKVAPDASVLNKALDYGMGDEASLISMLNSINSPKGELTLKMLDDLGQRTGTNYRGAIQEFIDTQKKLGSREAMDQLKKNLPEYRNLERVDKAMSFLDKPKTESATKTMLDMSPQAKALQTAREELGDSSQLAKQFSGWSPQNTESKLKGVMAGIGRGDKIQQTKELQALSAASGVDFETLLKNRKVADLFEKGYRNGSRNVNLWSLLGGAGELFGINKAIAKGFGGALGGGIDSFGPKMSQKVLDGYLKIQKLADSGNLEKLGKYAGVLSNAAKRGNTALTATHYMLMNSDPEYRKAIGE